jgi:transposase-like protein
MAASCSVCTHPDRAAIDEAVTSKRGTMRGIARQHGIGPDALERHAKRHLPGALVLASKAREVTRADDLLELLRQAARDAKRLQKKAEGEKDYRCAIAAVKTLSDVVEKLVSVGERLVKNDGPGDPVSLAGLVARLARGGRGLDPDAPLRVEYVNDWRDNAGKPQTQASPPSPDEEAPIPARLAS